jgi:hypothetical protein
MSDEMERARAAAQEIAMGWLRGDDPDFVEYLAGKLTAYAREREQWVSVTERLPEIGTMVLACKPGRWQQPYELVTYDEKAHEHRTRTRDDGQWWNDGRQITHWKPLSAPPEAPQP